MKRNLSAAALLLLLVLICTGCLGPKPVLDSYKATPPSGADQPFVVDALIHNVGPGDGQIEVEVSLTNKQTGQTIAQDSKDVHLEKDGTQHVLFNIDLPPSEQNIDPSNIGIDVQAHYPIE